MPGQDRILQGDLEAANATRAALAKAEEEVRNLQDEVETAKATKEALAKAEQQVMNLNFKAKDNERKTKKAEDALKREQETGGQARKKAGELLKAEQQKTRDALARAESVENNTSDENSHLKENMTKLRGQLAQMVDKLDKKQKASEELHAANQTAQREAKNVSM